MNPTALSLFLAALWWGSLSSVCGVFIPALYAQLKVPGLAEFMATRLLLWQGWLALGCAAALLLLARGRASAPAAAALRVTLAWVALGLAAVVLLRFAVAPRLTAEVRPLPWLLGGAALLALEWICATVALWRVAWKRS